MPLLTFLTLTESNTSGDVTQDFRDILGTTDWKNFL